MAFQSAIAPSEVDSRTDGALTGNARAKKERGVVRFSSTLSLNYSEIGMTYLGSRYGRD